MRHKILYMFFAVALILLTNCGKSKTESQEAAGDAEKDDEETEDLIDTDLSYFNFAKEVIDAQCANCHKVPATRGAPYTFRLDTYEDSDGFPGIASKRKEILAQIEAKTMPPFGEEALDKNTRKKFIEWLKGGAPKGKGTDPVIEPTLAPTVEVRTPSNAGDVPVMGIYDISVQFKNFSAGVSWTAYYTTVQGVTSGGTSIAANIDFDQTTYSWDTTAMANGTYFIYILVLSGNGVYKAASDGSVVVNNGP